MNPKRLKDILAAHADQLVNKPADLQNFEELSPEEVQEVADLLSTAELVQSTLKPVPTSGFETRLRDDLIAAAQSYHESGYVPPNPARDLMIILTTLGFVITMLVALILLRRLRGCRQDYCGQ